MLSNQTYSTKMQFHASEWFECLRVRKKTFHKPNKLVMWVWSENNPTLWGKWRGRQGYPPVGGETSRVISGRGMAPLLSGATLSKYVTNIVVDGTAAFYKHKASSRPLSDSNLNIHTQTDIQTHKYVPTHILTHLVLQTLSHWITSFQTIFTFYTLHEHFFIP